VEPFYFPFPHLSPYSYCTNNPTNAIDKAGKIPIFINGFFTGDCGGTSRYWLGMDK
jgi:hypothetical protein